MSGGVCSGTRSEALSKMGLMSLCVGGCTASPDSLVCP